MLFPCLFHHQDTILTLTLKILAYKTSGNIPPLVVEKHGVLVSFVRHRRSWIAYYYLVWTVCPAPTDESMFLCCLSHKWRVMEQTISSQAQAFARQPMNNPGPPLVESTIRIHHKHTCPRPPPFSSSTHSPPSNPFHNVQPTMSGLEIAASVAAIVSAFTGATNLFRSWRSSRRNKARASSSAPRDTDVETSLVRGSQRTQQEYDADYARLGRVFAVGDGTHARTHSINVHRPRRGD